MARIKKITKTNARLKNKETISKLNKKSRSSSKPVIKHQTKTTKNSKSIKKIPQIIKKTSKRKSKTRRTSRRDGRRINKRQ